MPASALAAALVLLLPSLAPAPASAQRPTARFEIVFERTLDGWRAICERGCNWRTLNVVCPTDCRWVIDDEGVGYDPEGSRRRSIFSFRFRGGSTGWSANALVGIGWTQVAYSWTSCARSRCRALLDQTGVSGF